MMRKQLGVWCLAAFMGYGATVADASPATVISSCCLSEAGKSVLRPLHSVLVREGEPVWGKVRRPALLTFFAATFEERFPALRRKQNTQGGAVFSEGNLLPFY